MALIRAVHYDYRWRWTKGRIRKCHTPSRPVPQISRLHHSYKRIQSVFDCAVKKKKKKEEKKVHCSRPVEEYSKVEDTYGYLGMIIVATNAYFRLIDGLYLPVSELKRIFRKLARRLAVKKKWQRKDEKANHGERVARKINDSVFDTGQIL